MKIEWPAKNGQPTCQVDAVVENAEPYSLAQAVWEESIRLFHEGVFLVSSETANSLDWSAPVEWEWVH